MRLARILVLTVGIALAISGAVPLLMHIFADSQPNVQLNVDNAVPHKVEDSTQKSILRDYTLAWQGLSTALSQNSFDPLGDNFTGFAFDKLTERVKDQQTSGLRTRIIDHGHKVDAIFYAHDGSAMELRDTASIETQILDGDKVIYSDQGEQHYLVVMTGAEDRWKVRLLESVP